MRVHIVIIAFFVGLAASTIASSPLIISEFMAGGRQGLIDEDGDTPDWIEIQNISAEAVNLEGWSLSDNPNRRRAWQFPSTNLAPGGFLIIFASGKDRAAVGGSLHTRFKLASRSGWVLLLGPRGEQSQVEKYPPQLPGVAFGTPGDRSNGYAYLTSPTPGRFNAPAVTLGPYVHSLEHWPVIPTAKDSILVKAGISANSAAVTKVTLRYRIRFGPEVELPMHAGEEPGDRPQGGFFSAIIPAGVARPGQMIRYCIEVEDSRGQRSRWPLFEARRGYSAYQGTIVADEAIQSRLPVLHLFTSRHNSPVASLFHGSELYDNVSIAEHGQISRGFPKPSYNLDFPHDHLFRYATNQPRVSDLKILGNFGDKSKIRNTLAYEMIGAAGSVGHFAFPVRIQLNGEFFCVAEAVEDGDDRWLARVGLDPAGALYKLYGPLTSNPDAEKKTRRQDSDRDLSTFADAISENRPLRQRVAYAYDHIDLPQCISYLVAMTIISSGDHGHKNFYLYRDTRGSGEWSLLPWDVDLSWGRNWMKTYFDDRIYADNPLTMYRAGRKDQGRNPLYNLIFEHPEFRQMYLRRLRTVMDQLLQPPGTAPESRIIEQRILQLMDLIDPAEFRESDADLDSARWPSWGTHRPARQEGERIITEYLGGRRSFLESSRATLYGDRIPGPQPLDAKLHFLKVHFEGTRGEQFVCLTNQNNFALDISDWRISGAGIEHRFRPGTVIPKGGALYLVADTRAFRRRAEPPTGGQSLFIQGNWKGSLNSQGLLRLNDGRGALIAQSGD